MIGVALLSESRRTNRWRDFFCHKMALNAFVKNPESIADKEVGEDLWLVRDEVEAYPLFL